MPKNKANDRNTPKSLTPKMRRFLDQLIERFGEKHTNIKRAELKKAAREILNTAAAPAWITRNLTVRNKEKRGMYDLSILVKLPVVEQTAEEPAEKPAKKKPAAKKAAKKTAEAPAPVETPETPAEPPAETPAAETPTETPAEKPAKKNAKKNKGGK